MNFKYEWDDEHKVQFLSNLNTEDMCSKFIDLFNEIDTDLSSNHVNNLVSDFSDIITKCADPFFCKTISIKATDSLRRGKPDWMTDECTQLKHNFLNMLNQHRISKSNDSRTKLVKARNRYTACAKQCRLRFDQAKTQKLINAETSNARDFWKLLRGRKPTNSHCLDVNDFYTYFKKLGTPADVHDDVFESIRLYDNGVLVDSTDEINVITESEVIKAIKQLKHGKSSGPDLLINEFFIYTCDILASKITTLFNVILMSGHFPKRWTEGVIIPIHKKGNKGAVGNYRGITLLSVFGKLFTRVLNNRLTFWAESYGILIEEKGGFREKWSTIDNIFVLHSLINLVTEKGGKVYTAFVDFRKAFDYVNRDCLWSKLITSGIRGNILNIIRSMYNEVKAKVKYMGNTSETFESFLGVRQGESLSPFLFCMFVNDLKYWLESKGVESVTVGDLKLCLILYADDSTLISANRKGL